MKSSDIDAPMPDFTAKEIALKVIHSRLNYLYPTDAFGDTAKSVESNYHATMYIHEAVGQGVISLERVFMQEFSKDIERTEYVPATWWDFWKEAHPRLTKLLPRKWRTIHHRKLVTKINLAYNYPFISINNEMRHRGYNFALLHYLSEDTDLWNFSPQHFNELIKWATEHDEYRRMR